MFPGVLSAGSLLRGRGKKAAGLLAGAPVVWLEPGERGDLGRSLWSGFLEEASVFPSLH